jgi:hypothetical protein
MPSNCRRIVGVLSQVPVSMLCNCLPLLTAPLLTGCAGKGPFQIDLMPAPDVFGPFLLSQVV